MTGFTVGCAAIVDFVAEGLAPHRQRSEEQTIRQPRDGTHAIEGVAPSAKPERALPVPAQSHQLQVLPDRAAREAARSKPLQVRTRQHSPILRSGDYELRSNAKSAVPCPRTGRHDDWKCALKLRSRPAPVRRQHRFPDDKNAYRPIGKLLQNSLRCRGPLQTDRSSGRQEQEHANIVFGRVKRTLNRGQVLR